MKLGFSRLPSEGHRLFHFGWSDLEFISVREFWAFFVSTILISPICH